MKPSLFFIKEVAVFSLFMLLLGSGLPANYNRPKNVSL